MGFFESFKRFWHISEPENMIEPSEQTIPQVEEVVALSPIPVPEAKKVIPPSEEPIPESETKYYQPDNYYQLKTPMGAVITFEERKKTTFPSKNGLYVAEILLLQYCSYGTYPHPRSGYPGFWWFEYGIRNVGAVLKSLEERGFIQLGSARESLERLTVAQLKEILSEMGLKTTGKKADLIDRLSDAASDEYLNKKNIARYYILTELGQQEIRENAYIKYIHQKKPPEMDIWTLNQRIHDNPGTPWQELLLGEVNTQLHEHDAINCLRDLQWQEFNNKPVAMDTRRAMAINNKIASLKDAGFDEYEYLALLETGTCKICGALDGKIFAIADAVPGVNLPPMHSGCRCYIGPARKNKSTRTGKRGARDAQGKGIEIPADMTYQQWYEKYVAKGGN